VSKLRAEEPALHRQRDQDLGCADSCDQRPAIHDLSFEFGAKRIGKRTRVKALDQKFLATHDSSSVRLTILAFSGERERERSDRRVRPPATPG
jgi:hypothetical protein